MTWATLETEEGPAMRTSTVAENLADVTWVRQDEVDVGVVITEELATAF